MVDYMTYIKDLHPDVSDTISVGYPTDIEADDFGGTVTPDFTLEHLKTMTVTSDFSIVEPAAGIYGHCEYLLSVTGNPTPGYWVVSAGNADVIIFGTGNKLYPTETYSLNIRRFSDTKTICQLINVSSPGLFANITYVDHDDVDGSDIYTVLDVDSVIHVDPTQGTGSPADITLALPTGQDRRTITVKNLDTTGSYVITLDPSGSETIEDDLGNLIATADLPSGNALTWIYYDDGSNYWRIT
jgi:hypothetical protein